MASRPFLKPHAVIDDGDMSGDITSAVSVINQISGVSYAYSWSGTSPVGTITAEVSNDYSLDAAGNVANAGTWNALPGLSGAVSGNTGVGFFDPIITSAYAIRTVFTRTSGTGTLQATIVAKVG
jgi:hypothetical protein